MFKHKAMPQESRCFNESFEVTPKLIEKNFRKETRRSNLINSLTYIFRQMFVFTYTLLLVDASLGWGSWQKNTGVGKFKYCKVKNQWKCPKYCIYCQQKLKANRSSLNPIFLLGNCLQKKFAPWKTGLRSCSHFPNTDLIPTSQSNLNHISRAWNHIFWTKK